MTGASRWSRTPAGEWMAKMTRLGLMECDLCKKEFRVGRDAERVKGSWSEYNIHLHQTVDKENVLAGDGCPDCTKVIVETMKGIKNRTKSQPGGRSFRR